MLIRRMILKMTFGFLNIFELWSYPKTDPELMPERNKPVLSIAVGSSLLARPSESDQVE